MAPAPAASQRRTGKAAHQQPKHRNSNAYTELVFSSAGQDHRVCYTPWPLTTAFATLRSLGAVSSSDSISNSDSYSRFSVGLKTTTALHVTPSPSSPLQVFLLPTVKAFPNTGFSSILIIFAVSELSFQNTFSPSAVVPTVTLPNSSGFSFSGTIPPHPLIVPTSARAAAPLNMYFPHRKTHVPLV